MAGLEEVVVDDDCHGSQAPAEAASVVKVRGEAAAKVRKVTNVAPDPRTNDEEGILERMTVVSLTMTGSY